MKKNNVLEKYSTEETFTRISPFKMEEQPTKEFLIQKFGGYFLLGENLGEGSFARVELAKHCLTNTKVALKIIDLDNISKPYTRKNILRESVILKTLRHQNIVRLYETLAHRSTYCFVIEYLEGGTLYNHMRAQKQKKFAEKQARHYFVQLLYVVQYLHRKGIIHRDLKLQNIMLVEDKMTIKLIDFGLSSYFNKDELLETRCGSTEYAAPELFDQGTNYGPSIEIWSMGVILFAMVTGKMPFKFRATDKRGNFVALVRKGLSIAHEDILKNISTDLKNVLIEMLEPDLDKRINLNNLVLNVWVNEYSKNAVLSRPTDVIAHDARKKVIEKLSELYGKPIADTIKVLNADRYDAMHATYQILLDKITWMEPTEDIKPSSPSLVTRQTITNSTHDITTKRGQSHTGFTPKETKRSASRPQSARPERRGKSILDNQKNEKFCAQNSNRNDDVCVMDYIDDDDDDDDDDDEDDDEASVESCLKITKKSPCSKSRPQSPPQRSFVNGMDSSLEQTPFRLTRHQRGRGSSSKFKKQNQRNKGDCFTRNESNTVESTIKGTFEFNSKDRGAGEASEKMSVESDRVRVTITGNTLSSGSFKISHESTAVAGSERVPLIRKHCGSANRKRSCNMKPCVRCVSPYEARQMVHRDVFPVKRTFVKATNSNNKSIHAISNDNSTNDMLESFNKQPVNDKKSQDDLKTCTISTPDTFARILKNGKNSTSTSRCSFKVSDEILPHKKKTSSREQLSSSSRLSQNKMNSRGQSPASSCLNPMEISSCEQLPSASTSNQIKVCSRQKLSSSNYPNQNKMSSRRHSSASCHPNQIKMSTRDQLSPSSTSNQIKVCSRGQSSFSTRSKRRVSFKEL